ncbi:tRNA pseudouridine13 synthase [Psychrobacter sp. PL15]|uniref:tRNA pseudouridine(13) synthase TruD n=1 Tax=Psychrobacter sp. PL15 TaxID=3071719 RepID=UPI002E083588|nr:tRNA pseudouridine13 synthase [Psychrobacter sp. PL15]
MTFQDNHLNNATLQPVTDKPPFDVATVDMTVITDTSQLPQPMRPPIIQATYKAHAADFVVHEILPFTFTGAGEHLWLHMQKIGMNTAFLAKLLAEWADIPLRDVGYSGLKDRHALTTQWFSLRLPKKQLPTTSFTPTDLGTDESVQILTQQWHNKKLNRGTHRANQFIITLRDVQSESIATATPAVDQMPSIKQTTEQHLASMSQNGVPNYFGPQRFGHGGNNIREALTLFARPLQDTSPPRKKGKGKRPPREQNAMALSAARSLIFNEVLAVRVRDDSWDQGMAGEVFNLAGSGSIFASEQIDDTLRARLADGDIHPTAVLWGIDNDKVSGEAATLEHDTVQQSLLLTELAIGLEQRDIKAQRRPLRLAIEALAWEWSDEQTLILRFTLPTGSFATSVLASLVQQLNMPSMR